VVFVVATPPPAPASPFLARDRQAIQRLLDRRSAAVMSGDKRAFMATVARGSPSFVRRQARFFDWMKAVPLRSYSLTAAWPLLGDLARPVDVARYPNARGVAIPATEERYRIRGFDDAPAEEDLFYTFIHEGDRWVIASDTDLNGIGMKTARHLWDFGPVTAHRSRHFLLFEHSCSAHIGCARLPSAILALAERALARVAHFWPAPWHRRIVILAPTTIVELQRMLQATFDVNKFVAFAYSSEDVEHGLRFTGRRIILSWRAIRGRSLDSTLIILAHELTHVATRSSAGPQIPLFIEEGLAEYAGYNGEPSNLSYLRSSVNGGSFDGKLPRDYQFTTGSGNDIYLSYQKGESAVRFFMDRWGSSRFVHFYRFLGRQRIVTGTARFHLDQALRRTTGIDLAQFQKRWASSLRG
jgi:hypothetical protein